MAGTRTLNDISDDILKNKVTVKKLDDKIKLLDEEKARLEAELMAAAQLENLTLGGGRKSKWKIEPHIVPQAENWDEFYPYMVKKKYYHLLQKRFAVKACAEIWELGEDIPGVSKFSKMKVSVSEK